MECLIVLYFYTNAHVLEYNSRLGYIILVGFVKKYST